MQAEVTSKIAEQQFGRKLTAAELTRLRALAEHQRTNAAANQKIQDERAARMVRLFADKARTK